MPDMSGYITGATETGPAPGGGTLTQKLNPFQLATRAAANLIAALFGGSVSGGGPATLGPTKLSDTPYTVKVGGTEYNAGSLESIVNAYGASQTANLINSGFFGQRPDTPLQVHPVGQNISTAPSAPSLPAPTATHTPAVPVAPAPVFSTQPVQHVESVSHPAVNILPARHYAPTTDITGKIIG